ncbi:hypothetical protein BK004_01415 [bacterium CG10_46_32]|nr:MAG: hypothetical protein BK004_01415 [bacterium CG10_46_32]PIR56356.1 MAG: 4-phosphopantetheinyl transferase [Parcubacteria group bacterium CG10_big_fil_rev_8_21_14_0_10_46_32]
MEILGVGTDIEIINSFRAKPYDGHKVLYNKIFSKAEISYCLNKNDSYASFAGKFCAKEAVIKAFKHTNLFDIISVEIINNANGEPEAFTNGNKLHCFLSISHTNDQALAFCVAYA